MDETAVAMNCLHHTVCEMACAVVKAEVDIIKRIQIENASNAIINHDEAPTIRFVHFNGCISICSASILLLLSHTRKHFNFYKKPKNNHHHIHQNFRIFSMRSKIIEKGIG